MAVRLPATAVAAAMHCRGLSDWKERAKRDASGHARGDTANQGDDQADRAATSGALPPVDNDPSDGSKARDLPGPTVRVPPGGPGLTISTEKARQLLLRKEAKEKWGLRSWHIGQEWCDDMSVSDREN